MLSQMFPQKFSALFTMAGLVITICLTRANALQVQPPSKIDTSVITELPAPVPRVYTLSPDTIVAGKSSTISLLGGGFICNTTFSRETVTVTGKRLDLSFVANTVIGIQPVLTTQPKTQLTGQAQTPTATPGSTDLTIACPMPYALEAAAPTSAPASAAADAGNIATSPIFYEPSYNPQFTLPPLTAGIYEVWATQMYECMYTSPYCKMAIQQKYAGTLTITDTDTLRSSWFLKQKKVSPQKPFSLQLLNHKYGNCQTSFSHQSVKVQNGELWFSFLIETDPTKICIANFTPFGPTYNMTAMSPGAYPIRVSQLLACQVNAPFCPIDAIIPPISDTLLVSTTTTLKSGKNPKSFFKASLNGSQLSLVLPVENRVSDGFWKVRLLTPSGKVVMENTIASPPPSQKLSLQFHLKENLSGSSQLFILQLQSQSQVTYTLPLVSQN